MPKTGLAIAGTVYTNLETALMAKTRFLLVEPSAEKPTPLFTFLSFAGRRIKVCSGHCIHPKQWDAGEQKALTRGYPRNGALNDWLKVLIERLETCRDKHVAAGTVPSAEELRVLAIPAVATPAVPEPEPATPAGPTCSPPSRSG